MATQITQLFVQQIFRLTTMKNLFGHLIGSLIPIMVEDNLI